MRLKGISAQDQLSLASTDHKVHKVPFISLLISLDKRETLKFISNPSL
jgi:hypothetical protein